MERSTPTPAVSAAANRRALFADNEPFASGWLPPAQGHEIYYEECGNPEGKALRHPARRARRGDQSDHAQVLRSGEVAHGAL